MAYDMSLGLHIKAVRGDACCLILRRKEPMRSFSIILVAVGIVTGALHQADRLGTQAGIQRYGQPVVKQITIEEMRAKHEQLLLEKARLELPQQFAAAPAPVPKVIPKPPRPLDTLTADLGISPDNTSAPEQRSPAAMWPSVPPPRPVNNIHQHPDGSIANQIDSAIGAR